MKKTLYSTLLLTVAGSAMLLASCGGTSNGAGEITKERQSTIAYQAVSSLQSIDTSNLNKLVAKFANSETSEEVPNETPSETPETPENPDAKPSEDDDIIKLLGQLDLALNNTKESLKVEVQTSDKSEYESKELVSFVDINGEQNDLTLYYNTVIEVEEEDDDDDEIEEKEIESSDIQTSTENTKPEITESETEKTLTGIIIKDDAQYNFESKAETEIEADETESELVMEIYLSDDKSNMIRCIQEYEKEIEDGKEELEEKYSYETIKDGKRESFYSFKHEIEEGEDKIKLVKDGKTYKVESYVEGEKTFVEVSLRNKEDKEVSKKLFEKIIDEVSKEVSYVEIK